MGERMTPLSKDRDMEVLLEVFVKGLSWKVAVPSVHVLMQSASLAQRVAMHVPIMLLRETMVCAVLPSMHHREQHVNVLTARCLGIVRPLHRRYDAS